MSEINPEEVLPELPDQEPEAPKKRKGLSLWLKITLLTISLLLLLGASVGFYFYNAIYGANLAQRNEDIIIRIPSGSDINRAADILAEKAIVKDKNAFLWACSFKKFKLKSGQYKIKKNIRSYNALIAVLRGEQEAVKLTFNNFRLIGQLAGHVSKYIESDSLSLIAAMMATDVLDKYGFKPETAIAMYIPNTYQLYWDTDANAFVKRMYEEYQKFWTAERLEKAKKQNLTPVEVYILASIVDAETTYTPEKPRVAGVYLNRLRTEGWKLEADPTVVFAGGDFTVRRVTNDMLQINSPYNTYKNAGLPPGPIRMASVSAIDAVLNAEEHDYWFFCAKVPVNGEPAQHAFAKTAAQHGANARVYRQWLNSQRIYK